jgi:hypothetical protein
MSLSSIPQLLLQGQGRRPHTHTHTHRSRLESSNASSSQTTAERQPVLPMLACPPTPLAVAGGQGSLVPFLTLPLIQRANADWWGS